MTRWRIAIEHRDGEPMTIDSEQTSVVGAVAEALHAYSMRTNHNLLRITRLTVTPAEG